MSNAILAIIGMTITLIAFAAFSVIQLGKSETRDGWPERRADATGSEADADRAPRAA